MFLRLVALGIVVGLSVTAGAQVAGSPQTDEARLADLESLYNADDYEKLVSSSAVWIADLLRRAQTDPKVVPIAVKALEWRGRARLGIGGEEDVKAGLEDFRELLKLSPRHQLPDKFSARDQFEKVRLETIGTLRLVTQPPDAEVLINGQLSAAGELALPTGSYRIRVSKKGYASQDREVPVVASADESVNIELVRSSATAILHSTPPEATVVLRRGTDVIAKAVTTRTTAPTAEMRERAERNNVPLAELSEPLVIEDLIKGSYMVEISKPCHETARASIAIDELRDHLFPPFQLKKAVSTLSVNTPQPGVVVWLNGEARGKTPLTISDVCDGEYNVELRSAEGRHFQRIVAKAGVKLDPINARPKPTFAVLSVAGIPDGVMIGEDLRTKVAQILSANSVTLLVPPADEAKRLLDAEKLPASWLAFDAARRPMFDAAKLFDTARGQQSRNLSDKLQVQGVAAVTMVGGDQNQLLVSLLANGSAEPDVIPLTANEGGSVMNAIETLDATVPLFRNTLGLLTIDVAGVNGAAIVRVDAGGPGAAAGLQAGETIESVDGVRMVDGSAFNAWLRRAPSDVKPTLQILGRDGRQRPVAVALKREPQLLSMEDGTILFNRLVVTLKAQVGGLTGEEETVTRLNLAIALMRLGNFAEARRELDRVTLPSGPGVSRGVVLYLLGNCFEGLQQFPDAVTAWTAAAAEGGALHEGGRSVKDLAQEKLAKMNRR